MNVTIKQLTSWNDVLNAARFTAHKGELTKEPSDLFKAAILRTEHSPIRNLVYEITMTDVPYYVAMHLVRHKFGVEWFVTTSREDRAGNTISRHDLPQDALVGVRCVANAQALISISRKRLCSAAHLETRRLWHKVAREMSEVDKIMADAMVPECVYRGYCPEMHSCGYCHHAAYETELKNYRQPIIEWRNRNK